MKTVLSTLAAVMIASASFAGAALAEGDYYDGAVKTKAVSHTDSVQTGSIDLARANNNRDARSVFEPSDGRR